MNNLSHRLAFLSLLLGIGSLTFSLGVLYPTAGSVLSFSDLLRWLLACSVTYLLLQGSDPGYLNPPQRSCSIANTSLEDAETGGCRRGSISSRGAGSTRKRSSGRCGSHSRETCSDDSWTDTTDKNIRNSSGEGQYEDGLEDDDQTPLVPRHLSEVDVVDVVSAAATSSIDSTMVCDIPVKNDESSSLEFCQYCNIETPVRSHHCRLCNRCVATHDHHCLVMNTCVGERNHIRFFLFLLTHTIALSHVLSCLISYAYVTYPPSSPSDSFLGNVLSWSALSVLVLALSLLILVVVFVLLVMLLFFHVWLISTSTTSLDCGGRTRQPMYMRGFQPLDLPFSRCLCFNWTDACARDDLFSWIFRLRGVRVDGGHNVVTGGCGGWFVWSIGEWRPTEWTKPEAIVTDSDDICSHPWQNKYYSCC